jgi:hypothetical protein
VGLYDLEHTKALYPFYSRYYLGRGLTLLWLGGLGVGSFGSSLSIVGGILGLVVLIWGIMYVVGHFIPIIPPPRPLVGGGQCSICSFVTTPITACCSGRGAVN